MKTYQSVKTQQKAGLLSSNETHVTLVFASGEQKQFSNSTFNRWWKEVPGEEFVVPGAENTVENAAEENANAAVSADNNADAASTAETANTEAAADDKKADDKKSGKGKGNKKKDADTEAASKEPKKRGREKIAGDHPLRKIMEDYATEKQGATIFSGQVTGFRSLKIEGHMYMAFNFNTKGVTLQLRSKAVEGLVEYKKLNHMFDARVTLKDDSEATVKLLKKLMDVSLEYQLKKSERKAAEAAAKNANDKTAASN